MTEPATRLPDKPFAPACERNRDPILTVLRTAFAARRRVLEIGSGTGQHAVHFAAAMPWLRWQCSDRAAQLPGIARWLDDAALPNTPAPVALDIAQPAWPRAARDAAGFDAAGFDAIFTANTLHIMGWDDVRSLFAGLDAALAADATVVVYGPFDVHGVHTSPSNRDFDAWLKARDPASGLRDRDAVDALARGIGLRLREDVAMPAHNRCLVWTRGAARGADA